MGLEYEMKKDVFQKCFQKVDGAQESWSEVSAGLVKKLSFTSNICVAAATARVCDENQSEGTSTIFHIHSAVHLVNKSQNFNSKCDIFLVTPNFLGAVLSCAAATEEELLHRLTRQLNFSVGHVPPLQRGQPDFPSESKKQ